MKTRIIIGSFLLAVTGLASGAQPVVEERVWSEDFFVATSAPRLTISNIWGNVRVRPGDDDRITITVDERRSAPSDTLFERSLELFKVNVDADESGVSVIVGERNREWRWGDDCRGCRVDLQFEVRVPAGAIVDVETVTDGRIDVAGVRGTVSAGNVNGPIAVTDLNDCASVESVNGAIRLDFALAPGKDCDIETINGDITLTVPESTGLDVALNLFNGRMVSELPVDAIALPPRIEQTQENGLNRYRIEKPAGIRVGPGGPTFSISSLNGDIRIKL